MRAFSAVALFISAALALTVTEPTTNTVWNTTGPHTVSWTSVSSDRLNFTILLTDQQVNPPYSQVLVAMAVTSDGTTQVGPPSSGWPNGKGFQINLVQSSTDLSAILAQSGQFTITPFASGPTSSSSSKGSSTYTATGSSPSSSTSASGAVGGLSVNTGFIAAVALLGAVLA